MSRAIAWIRSRSRSWMGHHCCNASGTDVWVAAVVVVDVVSQSHKESSCSTESAVCTATERFVLQCCSSTEPFGGTERLSLENVLHAILFCGLAKSDFYVFGRWASELAAFAAVLLAASSSGRETLDPVYCAASFLGIHSHFCSSRCSTVRSFVPVLWAACT